MLVRFDAVHPPRKSRSKVPRAALIDEVLNTRRSFADMGLRPAVWVESSKLWCWVWKEGSGLCFGAVAAPDQPAPEVLGEPGRAARPDAGEKTVVRQDGTFRSSDVANALLPVQRHRSWSQVSPRGKMLAGIRLSARTGRVFVAAMPRTPSCLSSDTERKSPVQPRGKMRSTRSWVSPIRRHWRKYPRVYSLR